jgi:ankyrin repeat protein
MTDERVQIEYFDVLDIGRLAGKIEAGADVNLEFPDTRHPFDAAAQGPLGKRYPLDVAIEYGCLDACRLLLKAGADPNRISNETDGGGHDPLWWVIATGDGIRSTREQKKEWIDLLLQAGANINGVDPDKHYCPLYSAFINGNTEAFEILVEAGADIINARRPGGKHYGSVPLMERISHSGGDQEIALFLLRRGIDDSFLSSGMTPFQTCVKRGMELLVSYYVRERGEDPAQRTESGKTMIQIAGSPGMKTLLRALKTECAVMSAVDDAGACAADAIAASRKAVTPL